MLKQQKTSGSLNIKKKKFGREYFDVCCINAPRNYTNLFAIQFFKLQVLKSLNYLDNLRFSTTNLGRNKTKKINKTLEFNDTDFNFFSINKVS